MFGIFNRKKEYREIDAAEFIEKLRNDSPVVLDVRTPGEFNKGHLPGAKNIDLTSGDFSDRIKKLNPDHAYLLYCRSGVRSARAASVLTRMGFKKVFNLRRGIAWAGDLLSERLE